MLVDVRPELIRWACERAGDRVEFLRKRFPDLAGWEAGTSRPSFQQLEKFAKHAYVPFGYFFRSEPPKEELPIRDLRTIEGRGVRRPGPNLLETIYHCQRQQAWYQEYAERVGEEPKEFVGSASLADSPEDVASKMRRLLDYDVAAQRDARDYPEPFRRMINKAEQAGVLVMVGGTVGSNTRRTLDPEEFRGFALADKLAPLVFINGADAKSAQMFTLAHELAHLWLGSSALSDGNPPAVNSDRVEVWCNRVAAEFLLPIDDLKRELGNQTPLAAVDHLGRTFKVSSFVVLRRLLDAGLITRLTFQKAYAEESARSTGKDRAKKGGNFYATLSTRTGRRFARALIADTLDGQTLYRDAYQLLGVRKHQTFLKLAEKLRSSQA